MDLVYEIVKSLTLEEKVKFVNGVDFWKTHSVNRLEIPAMVLSDGPHGLRKLESSGDFLNTVSIKATCFPPAVSLANSWNLEIVEKVGAAIANEAKSNLVNVLLGPGINIKRNPLCGRNFEYYSADPYLTGKVASAYIKGVQGEGISACIKHFAANNQEFRRMTMDSIIDQRTLEEIYLTAFEIALKEAKPWALMTSYNLINGIYTNENHHLLVDILRERWNYDGCVISDWGGNNDKVASLAASSDLEMPYTGGETYKDVYEAVTHGLLDEKLLDQAVIRIIKLAFLTSRNLPKEKQVIDFDKHHSLARKAHAEAIVLLKNSANALPLKKKEKVCLIGPFAKNPRLQGDGSSIVNPIKVDNVLDNISQYDFDYLGYEQGFNRYGKKDAKLLKKACLLSEQADTTILFLGLDEFSEAEGRDRKDILIPKNQIELLSALRKVAKKIIVILTAGGVVDTSWDAFADGLIYIALPGQAGALAILDVLSGKVNPSGKLTETFPYKYQDIPSSNYFPGMAKTVEYREGLFIDYRYYDKAGIKVKYPFGFGLSYTNFTYSDLSITDEGASFKLTNSGPFDGSEITQLYIEALNSLTFRVKKELKGFNKVFLKKGETKEVFIPFDEYTFRFYNIETSTWEKEPLTYNIIIASSVNEIKLEALYKLNTKPLKIKDLSNELPKYYQADIKNITTSEFERLLGFKVPEANFKFYRKKRLYIDYNTTIYELRFARGFVGRWLYRSIKIYIFFLYLFKKRYKADNLSSGVLDLPLRNISRMTEGKITKEELDALIIAFNGAFFSGLRAFIKERKNKK